ncbi:GM10074 [Drosophila sechellia]|uniref:GM10074 n=1 Tax=Drosophila sechellia TaxID=7238 RepID=B4ILR9_DROSE|nr:GM10074 [Drosophila sechellia]
MHRGDLVYICDPAIPRREWKRGVVEEVFTGKDGVPRRASVRTSDRAKLVLRPALKLAVLDVILTHDSRQSKWLQQKSQEVRQEIQKFSDFTIENGDLYRHLGLGPDDRGIPWKLCVATENRARILKECHNVPTARHLSIRKTILRISQM